MKIYCPVKKTVWGPINSKQDLDKAIAKSGQPFGVDQSGPACEFNLTYPCDKTFYQYMGWGLHTGIDIPVATGTKIYAAHEGKIIQLSDKITSGIGVILFDPVYKIRTLYWHLLSYSVTLGQEVYKGQEIGLSNNTGFSKGPHLHFELIETDEAGNKTKSIDPIPHFVWGEDMLTKEQVEKIYALWGLIDLQGVDFWTGKELDDLLDARLKDEFKQLLKWNQIP